MLYTANDCSGCGPFSLSRQAAMVRFFVVVHLHSPFYYSGHLLASSRTVSRVRLPSFQRDLAPIDDLRCPRNDLCLYSSSLFRRCFRERLPGIDRVCVCM